MACNPASNDDVFENIGTQKGVGDGTSNCHDILYEYSATARFGRYLIRRLALRRSKGSLYIVSFHSSSSPSPPKNTTIYRRLEYGTTYPPSLHTYRTTHQSEYARTSMRERDPRVSRSSLASASVLRTTVNSTQAHLDRSGWIQTCYVLVLVYTEVTQYYSTLESRQQGSLARALSREIGERLEIQ